MYINYNSEIRSHINAHCSAIFCIGHHSTDICTSIPAFHIYPPEKR